MIEGGWDDPPPRWIFSRGWVKIKLLMIMDGVDKIWIENKVGGMDL